MNGYIFLMHTDVPEGNEDGGDWESYLAKLRASGKFSGGSAIGEGACIKKAGSSAPISSHLGGYILVQAASLSEAKKLLAGNPVFEAGGTVEIRELPRTS